jgi:hypothetical protein
MCLLHIPSDFIFEQQQPNNNNDNSNNNNTSTIKNTTEHHQQQLVEFLQKILFTLERIESVLLTAQQQH